MRWGRCRPARSPCRGRRRWYDEPMNRSVHIVWTAACLCIAAGLTQSRPSGQPVQAKRDDSASEKLGWRLGVQTWTFRDRTLFEAIDTVAALGVKYVECFPGQSISKDLPDIKMGIDLSSDALEKLKAKLGASGVRMV